MMNWLLRGIGGDTTQPNRYAAKGETQYSNPAYKPQYSNPEGRGTQAHLRAEFERMFGGKSDFEVGTLLQNRKDLGFNAVEQAWWDSHDRAVDPSSGDLISLKDPTWRAKSMGNGAYMDGGTGNWIDAQGNVVRSKEDLADDETRRGLSAGLDTQGKDWDRLYGETGGKYDKLIEETGSQYDTMIGDTRSRYEKMIGDTGAAYDSSLKGLAGVENPYTRAALMEQRGMGMRGLNTSLERSKGALAARGMLGSGAEGAALGQIAGQYAVNDAQTVNRYGQEKAGWQQGQAQQLAALTGNRVNALGQLGTQQASALTGLGTQRASALNALGTSRQSALGALGGARSQFGLNRQSFMEDKNLNKAKLGLQKGQLDLDRYRTGEDIRLKDRQFDYDETKDKYAADKAESDAFWSGALDLGTIGTTAGLYLAAPFTAGATIPAANAMAGITAGRLGAKNFDTSGLPKQSDYTKKQSPPPQTVPKGIYPSERSKSPY